MQRTTNFSVRYLTEGPVPIRDIIDSLQGTDTVLQEMSHLLPLFINGLQVEKLEIKVTELAQQSPLREVFLVALFLAFQKQLEEEVPNFITDATGIIIANRFDSVVTVMTLIVVFYGVGAMKDFVTGNGSAGLAESQLSGLISELSLATGKTEAAIKEVLTKRYGEKAMWRRLANATSRFFAPSKRQSSAAVEANDRRFEHDVILDIPAEYLVDDSVDAHLSRAFQNASLELHAQDRDHAGRGWAAVLKDVSDKRLRLKSMDDVSAEDIWGHDVVNGDVTVIYDRIGTEMVPKEIQLNSVNALK